MSSSMYSMLFWPSKSEYEPERACTMPPQTARGFWATSVSSASL